MKLKLQKKSGSEKNILSCLQYDKLKVSQHDPFENMKIMKKSSPVLRPICHKRIVSDTSLNNLLFSGHQSDYQKNFDLKLFSPIKKNVSNHPNNPIFEKEPKTKCLPNANLTSSSKNKEDGLGKLIGYKKHNERNFMINKRVIKRVNNVIEKYKTKSERQNYLEFSFGN